MTGRTEIKERRWDEKGKEQNIRGKVEGRRLRGEALQPYLFDAWFFGVIQGPSLHVLWHQFASDLGDLLPVFEDVQRQMFLPRLVV